MHDILKHYKKAGWESIHYRNMCNAMEVHLEMKIKLIDFHDPKSLVLCKPDFRRKCGLESVVNRNDPGPMINQTETRLSIRTYTKP